jgi:hypothetical protein
MFGRSSKKVLTDKASTLLFKKCIFVWLDDRTIEILWGVVDISVDAPAEKRIVLETTIFN